jgi:hypothetical protein
MKILEIKFYEYTCSFLLFSYISDSYISDNYISDSIVQRAVTISTLQPSTAIYTPVGIALNRIDSIRET